MTTTQSPPRTRTRTRPNFATAQVAAPVAAPKGKTPFERLRDAEAAGRDDLLKLIYREMRKREDAAFEIDPKTGMEAWKSYTLYTPYSAFPLGSPRPAIHHISQKWTVILNGNNLPYRLDSEFGAKKFVGCPDQNIVSEYNAAAERHNISLRVQTKHAGISLLILDAIRAGLYRWEFQGERDGREAGWYSVPVVVAENGGLR